MGTQQISAEELARLLKKMDEKMTTMETEMIALRQQNEELRAQISTGSSASGPATTDSLAATITRLVTTEKKAKVPKPHDYDGDRQKLPTFCREAGTCIIDQGLDNDGDTERAINIIAGYMTGNTANWYTIAYATRAQNKKMWKNREEFWMDMKTRFGETNPTFSA